MKIYEKLMQHSAWLRSEEGAARPNLRGADLHEVELRGADLRYANLRGANLCFADLGGADLRNADLRHADLHYADLRGADLTGADLRWADLTGANLRGANLSRANLKYAILWSADLTGANLHTTNLRAADLRCANLRGADMLAARIDHWTTGIHPAPQGALVVWASKSRHIIKMLVRAEWRRSCATSRKFRSEAVEVLEIDDGATEKVHHDSEWGIVVYEVGKVTRAEAWSDDRWDECSSGIHWFLSRAEAEAWEDSP